MSFLVEIDDSVDLAELNRLFSAWLEVVYHRRVHSETGQTPLERFDAAGAPVLPTPALLREAFRKGFHNARAYEEEPDLQPLRDLPEFSKLLAAVRELIL